MTDDDITDLDELYASADPAFAATLTEAWPRIREAMREKNWLQERSCDGGCRLKRAIQSYCGGDGGSDD